MKHPGVASNYLTLPPRAGVCPHMVKQREGSERPPTVSSRAGSYREHCSPTKTLTFSSLFLLIFLLSVMRSLKQNCSLMLALQLYLIDQYQMINGFEDHGGPVLTFLNITFY